MFGPYSSRMPLESELCGDSATLGGIEATERLNQQASEDLQRRHRTSVAHGYSTKISVSIVAFGREYERTIWLMRHYSILVVIFLQNFMTADQNIG